MTQPYIGITGLNTIDHVTTIQENAPRIANYEIMLGFLSSDKRLAQLDVAGTQSPAANNLGQLTRVVRQGFLPMIHYHTKQETIAKEVNALFAIDDLAASCSALQLNVDWPAPVELETILETKPDMRIVLQLPKRAMEGYSTKAIAARASDYDGLAAYALIDPSGGLGVPFELESAVALLGELREALPNTMLGVAGGLGAENVYERFTTLAQAISFPFCIDAQGKLRGEDGTLDTTKAREYLMQASAVTKGRAISI